MANDPGLAADTCTFMEAVSGDGGTHDPNGVWWLSPDISLIGPISGPDNADPGQVNTVKVTFHQKATGCASLGDESITVQLWVGNPSLAMAPNNPSSTALIGFIGSPIPPGGGSATQQIDWNPPAGLPADDPQSPGHKCLIARCYSDSLTPSDKAFFVPDDPHVAQHNICIVPCPLHPAPTPPGVFTFIVSTINIDPVHAQTVTLRAVFDSHPNNFVRNTVMKRLERLAGSHRIATPPPRGFGFDVSAFHGAHVVSPSGATFPPTITPPHPPVFEATVPLGAHQLIKVKFGMVLTAGHAGDAYIFHLTQRGADHHPQGGLTLVMLLV